MGESRCHSFKESLRLPFQTQRVECLDEVLQDPRFLEHLQSIIWGTWTQPLLSLQMSSLELGTLGSQSLQFCYI